MAAVAYAQPEDLILLIPGMDPSRALQLIELASLVVGAWVTANLGNTIDVDDVPPQVRIATLVMAHRQANVGSSGDIVAASIDDASYRYNRPATIAEAFLVDETVADLLASGWGRSNMSGLGTIRTMTL